MYEAIEHWNKYQKEKREKEKLIKEIDKLLNKLAKKNGTTKY